MTETPTCRVCAIPLCEDETDNCGSRECVATLASEREG